MQVEVLGARLEEKERAAEIWHDVALTVEERPEVYMDSVKAMQGTIGAAVWEFNNSLEVHLQSVVDGRSQILEVEQATQWADLMKDYTLDDLTL